MDGSDNPLHRGARRYREPCLAPVFEDQPEIAVVVAPFSFAELFGLGRGRVPTVL